ncbi:uncharacterized protein [Amphiura filiformis]|uniref:uncharacterized protein isoform X2 n=1 Tax=Amphiura filiformis TaxID=82378 RepID=UPI003B21C29F
MTTVIQTTSTQPGGYPPPQQKGYPQQQGYSPPPGQPQQGDLPQQQQTTYAQAPPTTTTTGKSPNLNDRYNKKAGLVTGIMQIIAGGILVVLGIIVFALNSLAHFGWGIWGSICFYVVAGILGVVSKNQNKCVIIAYMVMSIIAAVCAGSQMIYDAIAAGQSRFWGFYICGYGYDAYDSIFYYDISCGRQKAVIAMHSLSSITALAEMIIAIVASAFCCAGCCCRSTTPTTQTSVVTYAPAAPAGPQVTAVSGAAYPPPTSYHQAPEQPPDYIQQEAQAMIP